SGRSITTRAPHRCRGPSGSRRIGTCVLLGWSHLAERALPMPGPDDPSLEIKRRSILAGTAVGLGLAALQQAEAAAEGRAGGDRRAAGGEGLGITRLETFKVKPRWLFLKIHPDAGIVGLGEPIVEGRADTVATAIKEIEPYLVGKDPRRVVHH